MATSLVPPPTNAPISERMGAVTGDWIRWFQALWAAVITTPSVLGRAPTSPPRTTAIPTTPLPLPPLTGGLYRVSWYLHITTVASGSCSVALTINWTEDALPRSRTTPAVTQATTGLSASGMEVFVADPNTAITYSTAVSSSPAGMAYRLGGVAEQL